jgi:hypothetical protein
MRACRTEAIDTWVLRDTHMPGRPTPEAAGLGRTAMVRWGAGWTPADPRWLRRAPLGRRRWRWEPAEQLARTSAAGGSRYWTKARRRNRGRAPGWCSRRSMRGGPGADRGAGSSCRRRSAVPLYRCTDLPDIATVRRRRPAEQRAPARTSAGPVDRLPYRSGTTGAGSMRAWQSRRRGLACAWARFWPRCFSDTSSLSPSGRRRHRVQRWVFDPPTLSEGEARGRETRRAWCAYPFLLRLPAATARPDRWSRVGPAPQASRTFLMASRTSSAVFSRNWGAMDRLWPKGSSIRP